MGKERGAGWNYGFGIQQLTQTSAEPKLRPHLRHLVRRVQGQGDGAERAEEGVNSTPSLWYLPSYPADTISFVLREWAVHM
jgi:hypothetical protein